MKRHPTILILAALLVSTGCGIKGRQASPPQNLGRIVTHEEIVRTGASTMWEALVQTVRYVRFEETIAGSPQRAGRRGESSMALSDDMPIYLDHVKILTLDLLASLPAKDIDYIQVINGVEATTYYGTNSGDGVILIHTLGAQRKESARPSPAEEGAPHSLGTPLM